MAAIVYVIPFRSVQQRQKSAVVIAAYDSQPRFEMIILMLSNFNVKIAVGMLWQSLM